MKKFISLFLTFLVLCCLFASCSAKDKADKPDFVDIKWTRTTEHDTEFLRFLKDGAFSYYCGCGDPVDDSDLCEGYSYNEKSKTITLDCGDHKEKIIVKEVEDDRLVLDFGGEERVFTKEKAEPENTSPETITNDGKTYGLLKYNSDIFRYFFAQELESYTTDSVVAIENDKWDVLYLNGDVYVLQDKLQEATAYFADDQNYYWWGWADIGAAESKKSFPLVLTKEEQEYIYKMTTLPKGETLAFDSIDVFGTLNKTDKSGVVSASIQLAFNDGVWYWRSDESDESQKGFPEYVYKLPDTLNAKLLSACPVE